METTWRVGEGVWKRWWCCRQRERGVRSVDGGGVGDVISGEGGTVSEVQGARDYNTLTGLEETTLLPGAWR